ncbi:hypothetical protein BSL78_25943 [Apostichopus japonicus]|uniref:Uncharacterized protein n=1 Tax=Stichopus japonicus TaxID=307972 RepID=A0A2G8JN80_STIJA|nr:hypothetical protein BSL78_25943 [Apostichopus japonicus]
MYHQGLRGKAQGQPKAHDKDGQTDSPSGSQRAAPVVVRAKRGAPESQGPARPQKEPEQTFPSDPRKARLKANKKPFRSSDRNGRMPVEESGTRRGTHTEIGSGSPSPAREAGGERERGERDIAPQVPAPSGFYDQGGGQGSRPINSPFEIPTGMDRMSGSRGVVPG